MPYQTPRSLLAYYQPLASHLQSGLNRPVRLVTAPDARRFGQRILADEYDLVLAPAHFVRLAQKDRAWLPLARNVPDNQVLLVTRGDGPIKTVADLKGGTLATAERSMLLTLAAGRWLETRHLQENRDYDLLETGGHASSIYALLMNQADVAITTLAGIRMAPGEDVRRIRVLQDIGPIPHLVFAARPGTDKAMVRKLQQRLSSFSAPEYLRIEVLPAHALAGMDVYLEPTRRALMGASKNSIIVIPAKAGIPQGDSGFLPARGRPKGAQRLRRYPFALRAKARERYRMSSQIKHLDSKSVTPDPDPGPE
jgi:ABC-type phosphate/phosphonate transport system substrate-binding protein